MQFIFQSFQASWRFHEIFGQNLLLFSWVRRNGDGIPALNQDSLLRTQFCITATVHYFKLSETCCFISISAQWMNTSCEFPPQLMHLISHVSSHLKVETKVKSAGTWIQIQPKAWCNPNAWECVTESTQRLHRGFAGLIQGDARQKRFIKDQPVKSILSYCTHTLISHGHKPLDTKTSWCPNHMNPIQLI